MLSQSLKEMKFFKVKYLLISFILFFVAALVFIISGLANGLSMDNASSIKKMDAASFYLQKDTDNRLDRSHFKGLPEEKIFNGELQPLGMQMSSLKIGDTDKSVDVTFMAVQPGSFLEPEAVEGKGLRNNDGRTLVLDDSLKAEGIRIGSELADSKTGTVFRVSGFTDHQTFSHTPVAFMSLGSWEKMSGGNVLYNAIVAKTDNNSLQKEAADLISGGQWIEKGEIIKGVPGYEAEQNSLVMMLAFLIVIAVFVLAAFFYIMTIQKINQFGILKAIGAKTGFLIRTTLFQVVILSILSIGAAMGFTWVALTVLPGNIPFVFDIGQLLKYSGALMIVSILGSLLSTINIVKADPIQAMGRAE